MENNTLVVLELSKYNEEYKTPYLYETWTWEGDESVLPYKVNRYIYISVGGIN